MKWSEVERVTAWALTCRGTYVDILLSRKGLMQQVTALNSQSYLVLTTRYMKD